MEEWRDVPGYEGFYQVSSLGRVRGVERIVDCGCRGMRRLPQRLLKQCELGGYQAVELNRDGRPRRALVHRLVCAAWHGPPPTSDHQVAHGDGARNNNRPENLRWATAAENAADRDAHGRTQTGSDHVHAKLNPELVREIRLRWAGGENSAKLAAWAGCSSTNIHNVVHRRIWKHVN